MTGFICETCGTQYPDSDAPPETCPICLDERQYIGPRGQCWVTMPEVARFHRNAWRQHAPGLLSLETLPAFGIAQRAFLLRTQAGNVLWDCLTLLDEATGTLIDSLGGLAAIAISHPHYYTSMGTWAARFGCQVHLHAADQEWVMRPDPCLSFWGGETRELLPGVTLIRCGGHYAGGAVLHWDKGAGVLLSGDILQVTVDRKYISVLRSYPNMLPVSAPAIDRVGAALAPFAYDAVYGAFTGREILRDGKNRVNVSLRRYRDAITGDGSAELQ
jgi:glyoxylase-like metal-dependent hydrolase (beta-lactamase superfamily II)